MNDMHHGRGVDGPPGAAVTALVLLAMACGYLLAVRRVRRRNPAKDWHSWRTASFLTGSVLLALVLLPPLGPAAHVDFRGHITQHMLIGMYAPLAFVLAAPLTLPLRALPPARARHVTTVLHSPTARVLAHPAMALLLSTGIMGLLYFTSLYNTAMSYSAGHWLMNAHFLTSGCLFAYAMPPSVLARPRNRLKHGERLRPWVREEPFGVGRLCGAVRRVVGCR